MIFWSCERRTPIHQHCRLTCWCVCITSKYEAHTVPRARRAHNNTHFTALLHMHKQPKGFTALTHDMTPLALHAAAHVHDAWRAFGCVYSNATARLHIHMQSIIVATSRGGKCSSHPAAARPCHDLQWTVAAVDAHAPLPKLTSSKTNSCTRSLLLRNPHRPACAVQGARCIVQRHES